MALKLTIEAPDVEEQIRKLQGFPAIAFRSLQKGIVRTVERLREEVVPLTPVDTGLLVSRWRVRVNNLNGIVFNHTSYAEFVHNIWPAGVPYRNPSKNKKALSGFLSVASDIVDSEVERIFKEEMDKGLEEITVN